MFLSSNDDNNKINELKLYRINITDIDIEFKNDEYKIRLPLKNILFINQHIFFKVKEIHQSIDNYYKDKFSLVLEKIMAYIKVNPYINENGYVLLTSDKIKINSESHYYTTHNAILLAPSQIDVIINPLTSVIPFLERISLKFSQLVTSNEHIIEQQNFDSSYKFNFIWKSKIAQINKSFNKSEVFVSLNKEGIYISSDKVLNIKYNFFL